MTDGLIPLTIMYLIQLSTHVAARTEGQIHSNKTKLLHQMCIHVCMFFSSLNPLQKVLIWAHSLDEDVSMQIYKQGLYLNKNVQAGGWAAKITKVLATLHAGPFLPPALLCC